MQHVQRVHLLAGAGGLPLFGGNGGPGVPDLLLPGGAGGVGADGALDGPDPLFTETGGGGGPLPEGAGGFVDIGGGGPLPDGAGGGGAEEIPGG